MEGPGSHEFERQTRIHPLRGCARDLEDLNARGCLGPRSARREAAGNEEPAATDDVRRVEGTRAVELDRAVHGFPVAALLRHQLEAAIVGIVPLDVTAQVAERSGAVGGAANNIVALPARRRRDGRTRTTGALHKLRRATDELPVRGHRDGVKVVAVTNLITREEAVRRPREDRDRARHRLSVHRHQGRTSKPERTVAVDALDAHPGLARKVDGGERERPCGIGWVIAGRILQESGAVVGLDGNLRWLDRVVGIRGVATRTVDKELGRGRCGLFAAASSSCRSKQRQREDTARRSRQVGCHRESPSFGYQERMGRAVVAGASSGCIRTTVRTVAATTPAAEYQTTGLFMNDSLGSSIRSP